MQSTSSMMSELMGADCSGGAGGWRNWVKLALIGGAIGEKATLSTWVA